MYDNLIFLSLRFCPKFCFQILRWNFGFSKQRSVCTFPSTLDNILNSNMLYKTKKTTSILCYAVFMKNFWLLQGNTNKEKLTWFSCQIWFQMPNMNRFKCSLHQTNNFFQYQTQCHLYLKSKKYSKPSPPTLLNFRFC